MKIKALEVNASLGCHRVLLGAPLVAEVRVLARHARHRYPPLLLHFLHLLNEQDLVSLLEDLIVLLFGELYVRTSWNILVRKTLVFLFKSAITPPVKGVYSASTPFNIGQTN